MLKSLRAAMLLALGVVLGAGLSVGRSVQAERDPVHVAQQATAKAAREHMPLQDAKLLAEVLEHVRNEYVENVSEEELMEAAIRGMIANLDPHSAFLSPNQYEDMRVSTSGEYSGVGIEIMLEDGAVRVIAPMENTPAARAGVLAGDTIVAVDDVPVDSQDLNSTIERMRGKVGTPVKITIARGEAPQPLEFTLERASVHIHSVRKELLDSGYGYVRISHFSETTAPDLEQAVAALKEENGGYLTGLVLDLRSNPGGVLEAAVAVSDAFLESGTIVTANGRARDAKFAMQAQPGDVLDGAPLVLLVNGGSASASEIVAGALKDHQRATLVGQKTYGKGSVQTVVPLSDGHAIKLTTSRYLTPSGTSIHQRGITPDVLVSEEELKTHNGSATQIVYGFAPDDYELRVALDLLAESTAVRQSRAQSE